MQNDAHEVTAAQRRHSDLAETKWFHAAGHKARKGVQELTKRGAVGEREGADGVDAVRRSLVAADLDFECAQGLEHLQWAVG